MKWVLKHRCLILYTRTVEEGVAWGYRVQRTPAIQVVLFLGSNSGMPYSLSDDSRLTTRSTLLSFFAPQYSAPISSNIRLDVTVEFKLARRVWPHRDTHGLLLALIDASTTDLCDILDPFLQRQFGRPKHVVFNREGVARTNSPPARHVLFWFPDGNIVLATDLQVFQEPLVVAFVRPQGHVRPSVRCSR